MEAQVEAAGDVKRTSVSVAIPKNWVGVETRRAMDDALGRLNYAAFDTQHLGTSISMEVGPAPEVHAEKRALFLEQKQKEIDGLVQKALSGQTSGLSFCNDAKSTLATEAELEDMARHAFAGAGLDVGIRAAWYTPDLFLHGTKFIVEMKSRKS